MADGSHSSSSVNLSVMDHLSLFHTCDLLPCFISRDEERSPCVQSHDTYSSNNPSRKMIMQNSEKIPKGITHASGVFANCGPGVVRTICNNLHWPSLTRMLNLRMRIPYSTAVTAQHAALSAPSRMSNVMLMEAACHARTTSVALLAYHRSSQTSHSRRMRAIPGIQHLSTKEIVL